MKEAGIHSKIIVENEEFFYHDSVLPCIDCGCETMEINDIVEEDEDFNSIYVQAECTDCGKDFERTRYKKPP